MSEMQPKLVLDTNTFVSAFFWEGNEAELLRKLEQGKAKQEGLQKWMSLFWSIFQGKNEKIKE